MNPADVAAFNIIEDSRLPAQSACLYVCHSVCLHISKTTCPNFTKFPYLLPLFVARISDENAIHYVHTCIYFRFCGFSDTGNDAYFAFAVVTGYMTEETCYNRLLGSFVQLVVLNYNEI